MKTYLVETYKAGKLYTKLFPLGNFRTLKNACRAQLDNWRICAMNYQLYKDGGGVWDYPTFLYQSEIAAQSQNWQDMEKGRTWGS